MAQREPTYEELRELAIELWRVAGGSLGFFEWQQRQHADVAPDERWLAPLRAAIAKGNQTFEE